MGKTGRAPGEEFRALAGPYDAATWTGILVSLVLATAAVATMPHHSIDSAAVFILGVVINQSRIIRKSTVWYRSSMLKMLL